MTPRPVISIGEILIDLIAPAGESLLAAGELRIREGGAPANVAVARPPSVVPGQSVQGVPMTPMLHAQNVAQYYMQMQQRGLTQEQLQAMVAQVSPAHAPDVRVCVLSSD